MAIPGISMHEKDRDGNNYRANLMANNTGIWEGGAWGSCDEWGLPLFALPPGYLAFDPPSGATPHEYGHTVLINGGGFNDTPYDGMWHEAMANWLMLQFNNSYPGPGGVGVQPYLSLPHGRNYYDAWQLFEVLREDPRYGAPFLAKLWVEANGNKARGAEYMFDAMVRLSPAGITDPYNEIKDQIGRTAAKSVTWDFERQPFFLKQSPRSTDPLTEMYRRVYTELEKVPGKTGWFRVPFAHAPMQGGYNMIPVALKGKKGGNYPITVDFQPLWDVTRGSDWRATLVAVSDDGSARYSPMWNAGKGSLVLSADENRAFLVVSATPDFMPFEGFSRPKVTELVLQPQSYRVAFVDTKATAFETGSMGRATVEGSRHPNGGGFVAKTATVEPTVFVGPNAMVLDEAKVTGNARIEDYAVVMGRASVGDESVVSGHALVKDEALLSGFAKVRDWATVSGKWSVTDHGRVLERAYLLDRGELSERATIKGNVPDYGGAKVSGYAIKEADCANSANIDKQVLMCWVWGIDQKYADEQPDTGGVYARYTFEKTSPIFALDQFGAVHGYLAGHSKILQSGSGSRGNVLSLDGKTASVELKKDVVDFREATYGFWLKWRGGAVNQAVLYFGDGAGKRLEFTPKAKTGKATLTFRSDQSGGTLETDAIPVGRWTHIGIVFADGSTKLFVDGRKVSEKAFGFGPDAVLGPNSLSGNTSLWLGRNPTGAFFNGEIDDFVAFVDGRSDSFVRQMAAFDGDRSVASSPKLGGPSQASELKAKWLEKPRLTNPLAVQMAVVRPTSKSSGVEYLFSRSDGISSGWITSNRWTDANCAPGSVYTYKAQVRSEGQSSNISTAVVAAIPEDKSGPSNLAWERAPVGISDSEVTMVAKQAQDDSGWVEYQFVREDGLTSGWRSSRRWTDTGLVSGRRYSYTLHVRDSAGNVSKLAVPSVAVVRDDLAPATYRLGEWQTRPVALLDNTVAMKAMSVNGENGCPTIEGNPVEYFFECAEGDGPDSGWIRTATWKTPALPLGRYAYRFKIRDLSNQKNETSWSSIEPISVTSQTGYRPYSDKELVTLDEGALVDVRGKVIEVSPDRYLVQIGDSRFTVTNRAAGGKTEPSLLNKNVEIQGCIWKVEGQRRIVWADLR